VSGINGRGDYEVPSTPSNAGIPLYNHGAKSAYTTLNIEYKLADLREAKEAFTDTKASWVLGEEEDGVPDMPNLWVMKREWRLYVDYIGEDSEWFVPGA
jgi:hypothetical protein